MTYTNVDSNRPPRENARLRRQRARQRQRSPRTPLPNPIPRPSRRTRGRASIRLVLRQQRRHRRRPKTHGVCALPTQHKKRALIQTDTKKSSAFDSEHCIPPRDTPISASNRITQRPSLWLRRLNRIMLRTRAWSRISWRSSCRRSTRTRTDASELLPCIIERIPN